MPTVISGLLHQSNITLKEVSERSSVPVSTLSNAAKKPIETWSIRVLNAFAKGLKKDPSDLLKILQPNEYELEIDDKEQTIQDVYIPDKELYQQIRFVVEMEHLEGWNPNKQDIEYLVNSAQHPDPKLDNEIDKLFGDQVDAK